MKKLTALADELDALVCANEQRLLDAGVSSHGYTELATIAREGVNRGNIELAAQLVKAIQSLR
jgi:hypothetical protein